MRNIPAMAIMMCVLWSGCAFIQSLWQAYQEARLFGLAFSMLDILIKTAFFGLMGFIAGWILEKHLESERRRMIEEE